MALFYFVFIIYNIVMNLKELRLSKGLTQSDASKITKIPLRTYKRYENDISYSSTFKYQQIYLLLAHYL